MGVSLLLQNLMYVFVAHGLRILSLEELHNLSTRNRLVEVSKGEIFAGLLESTFHWTEYTFVQWLK